MSVAILLTALLVLAAVLLTMALEALLSRHNERVLRAAGAVEPPGDVYRLMQLAYPLGFVLIAVEGAWQPALARDAVVWGFGVFLAAKALKYWAIASLGGRWSFRVLVLPGAPLVAAGAYRYLRHPNYVAVLAEFVGVALMLSAPVSGTLVALGFAWLIWRRIQVEEQALGIAELCSLSTMPNRQHATVVADRRGTRAAPALPRWARALDTITVLGAVLALSIAFGGGFRVRLEDWRLSFTSPARVALWVLLLTGIRHAVWRSPSLAARVVTAVRRAAASDALRAVVPPALASRALVAAVGLLAVFAIGYPEPGAPFRVSTNELINLPARWDAGWYLDIAMSGYTWDSRYSGQQNVAFFPAYPLLMRVGGHLLGGSPAQTVLAGVLISLAAFLGALVYLFHLARAHPALGTADRGTIAVVLLVSYPFAVFYGPLYTESIFLLGTLGAFWHAGRREWWRTFAWGLLVGLSRPNGFLLSIPLALLVVVDAWRGEGAASDRARRAWPGLLAAAGPGIGMLVFFAYLYHLSGNPLLWPTVQQRWGRTLGAGPSSLLQPYVYSAMHGPLAYLKAEATHFLDVLATLFALSLVIPVARRLGAAYAAYVLISVLVPLLAGGTMSMGRLTATLFPLFLYLAAVLPESRRLLWVMAFGIGQGFLAVLFFTWRGPV